MLVGGFSAACAPRASSPVPEPGPAGTYEVTVCRNACDRAGPGDTVATGYLVLEGERFALDEVPDPARTHVLRAGTLLARARAEDRPNACFVLQRRPGSRSHAGLDRVGFTLWEVDSAGAVTLTLYQSPDAGYETTLTASGETLRGTGESWGRHLGQPLPVPGDSIQARRIGAPDRARCIRAAEADEVRFLADVQRQRAEYEARKAARDSAARDSARSRP